MFCHICYYCGNCKRDKSEEAEWRYPQGINDNDSLSNWVWNENSELGKRKQPVEQENPQGRG